MGVKRTTEQAEDMAIGTVVFVPSDPDVFLYKSDDDTWGVYFRERSEYMSDYDVNASLNPEHIIVGETSYPDIVVQFGDFQQGRAEDFPPGTVHIPEEPETVIKDSIEFKVGGSE